MYRQFSRGTSVNSRCIRFVSARHQRQGSEHNYCCCFVNSQTQYLQVRFCVNKKLHIIIYINYMIYGTFNVHPFRLSLIDIKSDCISEQHRRETELPDLLLFAPLTFRGPGCPLQWPLKILKIKILKCELDSKGL